MWEGEKGKEGGRGKGSRKGLRRGKGRGQRATKEEEGEVKEEGGG